MGGRLRRLLGRGKSSAHALNEVAKLLRKLEVEGDPGLPDSEVVVRVVAMSGIDPAAGWVAEATWNEPAAGAKL